MTGQSILFEAFMVFYLLEILVLAFIAFNIIRESKMEVVEVSGDSNNKSKGPSPSDIIKMRAIAKEMERQNK